MRTGTTQRGDPLLRPPTKITVIFPRHCLSLGLCRWRLPSVAPMTNRALPGGTLFRDWLLLFPSNVRTQSRAFWLLPVFESARSSRGAETGRARVFVCSNQTFPRRRGREVRTGPVKSKWRSERVSGEMAGRWRRIDCLVCSLHPQFEARLPGRRWALRRCFYIWRCCCKPGNAEEVSAAVAGNRRSRGIKPRLGH